MDKEVKHRRHQHPRKNASQILLSQSERRDGGKSKAVNSVARSATGLELTIGLDKQFQFQSQRAAAAAVGQNLELKAAVWT